MSNKLEVLKRTLAKKEEQLNAKFDHHFATVKQANGQPLNDKRNWQATLNKWERQNEGIRTMLKSIEATKQAIEIEEGKIRIKHQHTFFVPDVDKTRIVWDEKRKVVAHKRY
jgi:hypothetical protein